MFFCSPPPLFPSPPLYNCLPPLSPEERTLTSIDRSLHSAVMPRGSQLPPILFLKYEWSYNNLLAPGSTTSDPMPLILPVQCSQHGTKSRALKKTEPLLKKQTWVWRRCCVATITIRFSLGCFKRNYCCPDVHRNTSGLF